MTIYHSGLFKNKRIKLNKKKTIVKYYNLTDNLEVTIALLKYKFSFDLQFPKSFEYLNFAVLPTLFLIYFLELYFDF